MADEKHGIEIGIDSRPASAGEDRVVRSLENIKRKTEEVSKAGEETGKRAGDGFAKTGQRAEAAGRSMDNIRNKANAAGAAASSAGQRSYDAWTKATTGIDRNVAAMARLHPPLSQIEASMSRVGRQRPFEGATRSASGFHSSLLNVRNAIIGLGLAAAARDITQTEVTFRGFNQALTIVTGSQKAATQELAFAEATAEKLGFRVKDITQGYVGFSAAARGTALEGEGQRKVFESITRASAAYGLSNEQLKGSLLAVQQMIGKGTVSAEELRGQLGERLPGAVQIAARAMNMTTGELFKMMEQGQLVSDVFLSRFADQLNKEIPQGAASANKAFNAFLSQLDRAKMAIAEGGFFEGMAAGAKALADALASAGESGSLQAFGNALGSVMTFLANNIDLIKIAVVAYATYFAAIKVGVILGFVGELIALERALGAATTAQALFGATAKGVQATLAGLLGTVGLLVAGVAGLAAIYLKISDDVERTDAVLKGVNSTFDASVNALNQAKIYGDKAADTVKNIGTDAADSAVQVNKFAGEVGNAAQQLYNLANARRQAAVAELQEKRTEASRQYSELWGQTNQGLEARVGQQYNGVGSLWDSFTADLQLGLRKIGLTSQSTEGELKDGMKKLRETMGNYDRAIQELNKKPLENFVPPKQASLPPPKPKASTRTNTVNNAEVGRDWTARDAAAEFRERGFRVTSVNRTAAEQQAQIDKWNRESPATRGIRPAAVGTSAHERNKGIDFGRETSIDSIRDTAKQLGIPIKKLINEGDHKHLEIGKGASDSVSQEMDRQVRLQKQRKENELDFWQTLKNEVTEAKLLPQNQEQYNKELQLAKVLADGAVASAESLTAEQRLQIAEAIKARDTQRMITDMTSATNDAKIRGQQIEEQSKIIAQGTNNEIEDALELNRRVWEYKSQALIKGIDLTDAGVKKAMEELAAREKTNIALERKNQLIREGNDLVDSLLDSKDPTRAVQRKFDEDSQRIVNSTRPQAEKDRAMEILKERFKEDMAQASDFFRQQMMEQIDIIASAFGGKIGQGIGSVLGLVTNIVAMGKDGYVAGTVGGSANNPTSRVATSLSNVSKLLGDTFKGKTGTFFKDMGATLGKASDGAAIGSQIAGLAKAVGIKKFSTTGSEIGGALGAMSGIPGGQFIGSIVGGIFGGLLKKVKTGSATFGMGANGVNEVTGTAGNSDKRIEAATGAAKNVIAGLTNIAASLGGTVTDFGSITLGVRDKDWRVNTGGTSLKKGKGAKDFGDDQEGAIFFAVQEAVKRGAIKGLSEATSRVIKSAGENLDAAVQAAAVYEDLVRQARMLEDPINGAFEAFNKGVQRTVDQLKAVGYTEEDLAKLQTVFAYQQKMVLEQLTEGYRSLIETMTKGPDSGKTIWAQFQDALSGFRTLNSSGTATQEEFTKSGQSVFDLARKVYGSATPEFEAIKAELVKATQDALGRVETAAAASKDATVISDTISAAATAAATQRDTTNDILEQIRDAIAANPLSAAAAVRQAY